MLFYFLIPILLAFFWAIYYFEKLSKKDSNEISTLSDEIKVLISSKIVTNNDTSIEEEQFKNDISEEKIKILIENMHYSGQVKHVLEKKYNYVQVDSWDSNKLLAFLDLDKREYEDFKGKLLNYDIVAFPYFSLKELIDENIITSLEKFYENSEMAELFDLRMSKRFNETLDLVKDNGKTYGIPFTKISSILVYRSVVTNTINGDFTYKKILEKVEEDEIKFGLFENLVARSHYYNFLNIYYSLGGQNFYEINNNTIHFLFDDIFNEGLEIYLRLYRKSVLFQDSWNENEEIKFNRADMVFLWSEQLSKIFPNKNLEFKGYVGIDACQSDGWFFSVIKRDAYKSTLQKIINDLSLISKAPQLLNEILSTPILNNDIEMVAYNTNIDTDKHDLVKKVDAFLKKSISKPQNRYNGDIMKVFTEVIINSDIRSMKDPQEWGEIVKGLILRLEQEFNTQIDISTIFDNE